MVETINRQQTDNDGYVIHQSFENRKEEIFKSLKVPIVRTLGQEGYKFQYINWLNQVCKCEIDKHLKEFLDMQITLVANNFDSVGLITGMEGSAKTGLTITNLMTYICHVLGTHFDLSNVCFSIEQLNEKLDNSKDGDVISLDEFVLLGSSDETMTRLQKLLRKKFTLIRKKRLFIFLVIPSIHMLNKYFAFQRTRYCINCLSFEARRGYANIYGYKKKNYLCMNGHKTFSYEGFKFDQSIKFLDLRNKSITGNDIIDWDGYEKKKDEAIQLLAKKEEQELKADTETESAKAKRRNSQQFLLVQALREKGTKDKDIISLLGIEKAGFYETLRKGEANLNDYIKKSKLKEKNESTVSN